jgi:hypothetical protein
MAIQVIPEKICKKCGSTNWIQETRKTSLLGYVLKCSDCNRKRGTKWLRLNRDLKVERQRVFRETNRDRLRQREREIYQIKKTDFEWVLYRRALGRKRKRIITPARKAYRAAHQKNAVDNILPSYVAGIISKYTPYKASQILPLLSTQDLQQFKTYLTLKREINGTNI